MGTSRGLLQRIPAGVDPWTCSLKKHTAGLGLTQEPREMLLPADVEGHRGADGRYYLLDVQRLFPSEQEARYVSMFAYRSLPLIVFVQFTESIGIILPAKENEEMRVVVLNRQRYAEDISAIFGDAVDWVENIHQELLMVIPLFLALVLVIRRSTLT